MNKIVRRAIRNSRQNSEYFIRKKTKEKQKNKPAEEEG